MNRGVACCEEGLLRLFNLIGSAVKIVRREYSKADVRELRAHPKARTPVIKIAKMTKRTVGSLRPKALKLGLRLGLTLSHLKSRPTSASKNLVSAPAWCSGFQA
jgi:hypothetical protein